MKPIRPIALMTYGSHLFGSTIASSDRDYVGAHLPSGRGILLGRPETIVQQGSKAKIAPSEGGIGSRRIRETRPDEIDAESHALGKFFAMLRSGHMLAVDMLFVPDDQIRETSDVWEEVRSQRDRLISRNCQGFVGYATSQAEMYGRKASRLGEVRALGDVIATLIARHGREALLQDVADELDAAVQGRDHISVIPLKSGHTPDLLHLQVASKHIAYTQPLEAAERVIDSRIARYGKRAQNAQSETDWKSIAHAVRVAHQAIELLQTGHITFPRPEAEYLRSIRRGEHERRTVGLEIDRLLLLVEQAAGASNLPDKPDEATMDDIQFRAYARQVMD